MRRWFLNFFGALLWRKNKLDFLLASIKALTYLKTHTETLFKMLVAAFRKPPVILKSNAFSWNCGHVRDDKNFVSQKPERKL
jgi:hypothetical protein